MNHQLEIKDLTIYQHQGKYPVCLVNGVDMHVDKGEIVGICGPSGSGKSLTALAVMGLLNFYELSSDGKVFYNGKALHTLTQAEYRRIRGKQIGLIFQNSLQAFNPSFKIKDQIYELEKIHEDVKIDDNELDEQLQALHLDRYRNRLLESYPHQLSGGELQRMAVVM